MTALYQNQTIRQVENTVYQQKIATDWELMQRAGHAACLVLRKKWPSARKIAIVCGKGNNAGDGFVLAHEAHLRGLSVRVYHLVDAAAYQGPARKAFDLCESSGVFMLPFAPDIDLSGDLVVDAILGTGIDSDIEGDFKRAIEMINQVQSPVFAIDVPSGINADTGAMHGVAVRADMTITFIGLKQGLFTGKGITYAGDVLLDDLSVPPTLFPALSASATLIVPPVFTKRKRDAHKGDFGHVLVIGGDYGMGGAVRMAAEAALRIGAGLVSVATRDAHVGVVSGVRPEIMCHSVENVADVQPLLEKASVIVIGPGLSQSRWAKTLLDAVLSIDKPCLLDADALNNLAEKTPIKKANWILTPHPGEAARLLKTTVAKIQVDRFTAAKAISNAYGGVCVLKGAGTIVQGPEGVPAVCAAGNPGMATAGMGDVLSGVIGGLLAQGLTLKAAATSGVMLHAMAADIAAKNEGERGLLATDLMLPLRHLVNGL